MEEFEEMLLTIRAVVGSFKGPVPIQTLANDYEALSSSPMPWQESGHPNLESFLRSFPSLRIIGSGQNAKVDAVSSKESSHISKLISKQKGQTKQENPLPTTMKVNTISLNATEDNPKHWTEGPSSVCPECGETIQILNDDFELSMNLHRQSHPSLAGISEEGDSNTAQEEMFSMQCYYNEKTCESKYFCPKCKDYIDILGNNLTLSIEHHLKRHGPATSRSLLDHQSTLTSSKSKNSILPPQGLGTSDILESLFSRMKPALKCHRGFISQDQDGKVKCDVCNIDISPSHSVSDHLMTRMHEDNSINLISSNVPKDLLNIMDFVSFHESQLWCNLCHSNIEWCPQNPYKTMINIISHNNLQSHQVDNIKLSCVQSKKSTMTINKLARMNSSVKENAYFIGFTFKNKINSRFKCNLCNVVISSSNKESNLLKTFVIHFKSSNHLNQRMLLEEELGIDNRISEDIIQSYNSSTLNSSNLTEKNGKNSNCAQYNAL